MATFEAQVKGYTGLTLTGSTVPTQDELTQYLKDGVIEVTTKAIQLDQREIINFQVVSGEQTSNGFDVNGATVIAVLRESGTNNDWRECSFIVPAMQARVQDVDSLFYASKFNPVYTILENGEISVFPEPGANPDTFKVYRVNNVPTNQTNDAALVYTHSDIKYFPTNKVYLVVIYAAIKVLQAKLSDLTLVEEDPELVQALTTTLSVCLQQYNAGFGAIEAEAPQAAGGTAA